MKFTSQVSPESCGLYCLLNRKEQPVKSQYWMTHKHQMTNRRHSFLCFCLLTWGGVQTHCHFLDSQSIVRFPKCKSWIWLGTGHAKCFFIPSHYYLYPLSFHVGDWHSGSSKESQPSTPRGFRLGGWGGCGLYQRENCMVSIFKSRAMVIRICSVGKGERRLESRQTILYYK